MLEYPVEIFDRVVDLFDEFAQAFFLSWRLPAEGLDSKPGEGIALRREIAPQPDRAASNRGQRLADFRQTLGVQFEFQALDFVFEMIDDGIHALDHGIGEFEQQVTRAGGSMPARQQVPNVRDFAQLSVSQVDDAFFFDPQAQRDHVL